MKKITYLFLTLLFGVCNLKAQTINTTMASDVNYVFSPLEKNRVPNNILLDYGYDLIDATGYDGVLQSNNYMSIGTYKTLYNTIVSSCTALNVPGIFSPSQEFTEWGDLQKQANETYKMTDTAPVVLSGLLYNYSKINPNALANNKIQVINGKYDDKYINGVWQNPYDSKTTFGMAAPVLYINKPKVTVSLPTTLWHTNAAITSIAINFGEGGKYKTLNNGVDANYTYLTAGVYTWTYRILLNNGQYLYCRQKVKVDTSITQLPWNGGNN